MEDSQLTQNNSPAAGPLVAKTSDGLNLSVQTYGDVGNNEILFIHGLGQSRLSWSKQTSSSRTEHYRVVTFDLRGHGNSDKPDHAAAYASGEQWADDLHAVMETAGLRRPTLVGWSLGGFIIGLYLAKYGRERTAGINLVDAVTVFSPELEFLRRRLESYCLDCLSRSIRASDSDCAVSGVLFRYQTGSKSFRTDACCCRYDAAGRDPRGPERLRSRFG